MESSRIDEISAGIYRIHTPVPPAVFPGGFSFNQYLIVGEAPLLFHTGSRRLFPLVSAAITRVMPLEKLRHVAFSHHEQDEDGALDELLAAAPHALPVCSMVNAMINGDGMDRPPTPLADGATLDLGGFVMRWFDTPHLPHGWETGYLFEERTRTLFCGDLFTQPGTGDAPVTEADILEPSETFRTQGMDYFAHGRDLERHLSRLASTRPATLACMHGSAWKGDGEGLLARLGERLGSESGA